MRISGKITDEVLGELAADAEGTGIWNKYRVSLCDNGYAQFYMLHKKLVEPKYTAAVLSQLEELQAELEEIGIDTIMAELENIKAHPEEYKVIATL